MSLIDSRPAMAGNGDRFSELLTELRQAGKALNRQYDTIALTAAFIDQMPRPAWIKSVDHLGELRMIRVNTAWQEQIGLSLDACVAKSAIEPKDVRHTSEWEANDRKVLSNGLPLTAVEHSDGDTPETERHWRVLKFPLFDKGEIVAVCGMAEEIAP